MVDETLHAVSERCALYMREVMRWLVHQDVVCDNEDAAMYALLVRAAILAAADRGELKTLGVTSGRQIRDLRIDHHVHTAECGHGRKVGDITIDLDWSATPLQQLADLPERPDTEPDTGAN